MRDPNNRAPVCEPAFDGVRPVRRRSRLGTALLRTALLAIPLGSVAAEPLWGVNGHPLTSYPGISLDQQLDLLTTSGMKSYRVDVTAFPQLDRLRALVDAAKARGLTILPVLIPPVDLKAQSEDALYTQARQYAKVVVDLFKGEIPVWELGNELENYAILQPCEMRDDGTQYPCNWGPAGGVEAIDYFGPRARKVLAVLRGLSDGVAIAERRAEVDARKIGCREHTTASLDQIADVRAVLKCVEAGNVDRAEQSGPDWSWR